MLFWRTAATAAARGSHDPPLTTGNRHLQASVLDQIPACCDEVPAETRRAIELISIGSVDLSDAQRIDASAPDD
jgi:hypothetical protein